MDTIFFKFFCIINFILGSIHEIFIEADDNKIITYSLLDVDVKFWNLNTGVYI